MEAGGQRLTKTSHTYLQVSVTCSLSAGGWPQWDVSPDVCGLLCVPASMQVGVIPGSQLRGRNQIDFYHVALKVSHLLIRVQVSLGTPCSIKKHSPPISGSSWLGCSRGQWGAYSHLSFQG